MSSTTSSKSSKTTAKNFLSLEGRISIVTGASRGIGAATALELAKVGSAVALFDIDEKTANETARRVADEAGATTRVYRVDVTDRPGLRSAIERVNADFGAIDHLVNNAGIQFVNALETFPDEKWDLVRSIDLDSVFHATKAVWPYLKARGRGRIVNLASVQGIIASPYKAAYVTSKHGVIGLTMATALEGAEHGITANAVCPGAVRTDLALKQAPDLVRSFGGGMSEEEALKRAFLTNMPTQRFIEPEEVAQLIVYLCTDAARSITGAALPIDGGWTAH